MSKRTKLTERQKLFALSNAMYQGGVKWEPKPLDYYTSSRSDLELYQIVAIENGIVFTVYCHDEHGDVSQWPLKFFLTEGFGPNRIYVPDWIFNI